MTLSIPSISTLTIPRPAVLILMETFQKAEDSVLAKEGLVCYTTPQKTLEHGPPGVIRPRTRDAQLDRP